VIPHLTEIYVELYRRREYDKIPLGELPDGTSFYMTPKQLEAVELLNDKTTLYLGFGGSSRSGKTLLEVFVSTMDCLAYPGIAWGIGRRELKNLRKTVLRTMFSVFNFYGLELDRDYKYDQNDQVIKFKNGSEIFLIDTAYQPRDEMWTRWGGMELTRAAIDESNETRASGVSALFSRTGWRLNMKYGLKRKMLETFNPEKVHVYSRYYIPYRDKRESDYKKFIPALPGDNPHPAVKEWIDDIIRAGDKIQIQRLVFGNFEYDDDPNLLVEYDAILDLFENHHVKAGQDYLSSDIAMQGRDKFLIGRWSGFICHIPVDKPKTDGKENETDLRAQMNEHGIPSSRVVVDSDGLGAYLSGYIKNIKTFHGGARAFNSREYANLKAQCGFILASMINKREIRIVCSEAQKEAIKEEISACLKRDNVYKDQSKKNLIPKDRMKDFLGRSPDYLDMLLMRMIFTFQAEVVVEWN